MKTVAIIGSTGSIGTAALKVCAAHPEKFRIVGLAAGKNVKKIAEQVRQFQPRLVCLASETAAAALAARIDKQRAEVVWSSAGLAQIATMPEADIVISAISGAAGLLPTLAAIKAGKDVALANKEALVMAGELLTREAARQHKRIIPVDSEHSAIAQILDGRGIKDVRSIILTASGGPFLNYTRAQLARVTPRQALRHPRWKMGTKVTIDSATLMNKGLEVIEARWLFGIAPENIRVVIHPQSIIHSMVEYIDGTVLAHLSQPDMKGPIAYALWGPERLTHIVKPLNISQMEHLTFREPDRKKFPCLNLAYGAISAGGLMPAVMNAANEIAVQKFLDKHIRFTDIARIVEQVMGAFKHNSAVTLEAVLQADTWARTAAETAIKKRPTS
jgi:1-deoxy-D-xylulose-5-phosphate reductoisomerase